MWPAKQLDIGWRDLAVAARKCLTGHSAEVEAIELEADWIGSKGLTCLSVRSGFDLLLEALALPPGSEILISAVTIPDMIRVVDEHRLVTVPIDLDLATLAPLTDSIEAAITPRTRAIVIAHLFGARIPLEPIQQIARRHGLMLIEDLAQGFASTDDLNHSESDVAMFSFGTIKTATALGGAILRVRDAELLTRMRQIATNYPRQSTAAYLSRVLKYGLLKAATTWTGYTALVGLLRALGSDHDRLAARLVRGFPAERLFEQLRQRPCGSLLGLLRRRLEQFDVDRLQRRRERGRKLATGLEASFFVPGFAAKNHSWWIFPVLADRPQALIEHLGRAGFHATQGRSMCAVEPPADRPELRPANAQRLLQNGVFLPAYPELTEREYQRLSAVLLEFAREKPRESAVRGYRPPAYWTAPLVTARKTSSSD
jgi:dTDP-4-amino-4,6-dideoxygalactose transaminase